MLGYFKDSMHGYYAWIVSTQELIEAQMCIDFLAFCCLSLGKWKNIQRNTHFRFIFFCSVALCIFILHSLNWCQSQPVSICVFVCCLTVCVSVSLLGPCCWRTSQAVPNKRAQGGLLWQQLVWCAALSVFVCVLSPGHAGQTGPVHMEPAPLVSFVVALGVFPIGAWSIQYHATSSHSSSSSRCRKAFFPSPFFIRLLRFSRLSLFPVSNHKMFLPISLTHPPYPSLSP